MEFIQRVEEKLTKSQASITLSAYRERRRLARVVEMEARIKETYDSVIDIFDRWIDLNECQGIAKEAKEGEDLMDVESSTEEEKESDEKQDSCVEHIEHAYDLQ
ncbi:uncharacterized protein EAE97_003279 [Botrytis byssoidea]|uniref:Uncharacterized protein n=1 Tax=Botrytis byssoidea TaxID=139641 RepID=A0A9P5ITN0_9HELO|nr:uncharacterized protein EAE97_003279 [Botrytis byssoidea]KAF7949770.1 hypothetical protein EAE97_003279 [Botrytis byssoidea]